MYLICRFLCTLIFSNMCLSKRFHRIVTDGILKFFSLKSPPLFELRLLSTQSLQIRGRYFEAWTRPEPETTSPNSARARFRPENQISRVSQDMRICGVQKNVVYGYSCKCTVLSHHDHNIGLNKHKLSLLVNANAADCNISQEKMKISGNYPRWHDRHQRNYLVYRYTHEKLVCRPSFSWNKPRIARVAKLFRAMPLQRIAC